MRPCVRRLQTLLSSGCTTHTPVATPPEMPGQAAACARMREGAIAVRGSSLVGEAWLASGSGLLLLPLLVLPTHFEVCKEMTTAYGENCTRTYFFSFSSVISCPLFSALHCTA